MASTRAASGESATVATPRVSRWPPWLAAFAGVAMVAAIVADGELGLFDPPASVNLWVGLAPGVAWLGTGLVAWGLRPASLAGPLMTAVGFAYFAPSVLVLVREPLPFTLSLLLWGLPLAIAAHLFVVFPDGGMRSPFERALIASAYVLALASWSGQAMFRDPLADLECQTCPENLLLVESSPETANAVIALGGLFGAGIALVIAALLVRRWRAATPTARTALAPILAAGVITALLFIPLLALGTGRIGEPISPLGLVAWLGSAVVPLAFLLGLLRTRLQQGGVADLVVELGSAPSAERIRELLARTLGDASLEVAFWRPDVDGYVDAAGGPVALPEHDGERAVSVIDDEGARLAALVHDRSLLENPRLLNGASAAARLALENARLQAELRAQLREVRASRERIVEAGDTERRRIERNLHDGAQQRLLAIRLALRVARRNAGRLEPQLEAIDAELADALEELRTLARGLHPPILTEQGLAPALETLARRAAIPVEFGDAPSVRLPPAVETAAYYVASEGLANAVKHARASHARIDLQLVGRSAVMQVADDGAGGADPHGSGLRGLRDRVEALDGSLTVTSQHGHGTTLRAVFPCA